MYCLCNVACEHASGTCTTCVQCNMYAAQAVHVLLANTAVSLPQLAHLEYVYYINTHIIIQPIEPHVDIYTYEYIHVYT